MTPGWLRAPRALALWLVDRIIAHPSISSGRPEPVEGRNSAGPVAPLLVHFVVKHPWLTAGAIGVMVATAGLLVVVSGVVPIKASAGHWAITARFLDFAKVRSVATHSLGIQPPPLEDQALVLQGAGHYEGGCYPCHGRPGGAVSPVMAAMTPAPPELSSRIPRWTPEELFTIVKHGIKLTGMPAWPAQQRDDEVWAMVAFLRKMPNLDAAAYQTLVYGESGVAPDGASRIPSTGARQPPRVVREICWRCHGLDGTGRGPGAFPSLAGQRAVYLYAALRAFADRDRFSGIMGTIAANLSDEMIREVATYYEGLPPRRADGSRNTSAIARGEEIARRGIPDLDVPSCADCHGPGDTPRNPAYPLLAGQHTRYLSLQLQLFKGRRRGGSDYANLMHVFVGRLGAEQITDVTLYYGSLETPLPNVTPLLPAQ
jgi:cytochrome c553